MCIQTKMVEKQRILPQLCRFLINSLKMRSLLRQCVTNALNPFVKTLSKNTNNSYVVTLETFEDLNPIYFCLYSFLSLFSF